MPLRLDEIPGKGCPTYGVPREAAADDARKVFWWQSSGRADGPHILGSHLVTRYDVLNDVEGTPQGQNGLLLLGRAEGHTTGDRDPRLFG